MLLQAYDFQYLHETMGVTVQMGGSDQWGNIVAGSDLIRKVYAAAGKGEAHAFGLTTPLVTKADGTKFGKTESGAVWMTADRTSPYQMYQFWLNADDTQVINYLNTFTFLPKERIAELAASHAANPGQREAHRALADAATELLHGPTERANAQAASKALFSGDVSGLSEQLFTEVFANVLGVPVLQGGQCTGCHGSMGSYTVGSTANAAWSRIVNVAHNHGAGCRNAGVPSLIVPNDKARSLLYLKMVGMQPAACGGVMPLGTTAIPPSPPNQAVTLGTWIRLGAPND